MFKHVTFPEWTHLLVAMAFVFIATVFIAVVVRVLRSPDREIERLSRLPLEPDQPRTPNQP
ncbi:MAG: hypothetical protein SFU85_02070 [Candidatus Methylacidiphilales bacterium]|nr:hypothetical protein [Candidatus Methylacidiphilales bacterium]